MGQVARKADADVSLQTKAEQDLGLVERACIIVANGGSLDKASRQLGIAKFNLWRLIQSNPEHASLYAHARACRAQYHERKIVGASKTLEDIRNQSLDDDVKIRAITQEVKARQWLAKVSDPHMFGDRTTLQGGDKPLQVEVGLSPNEHARRIAFALLNAAVQQGAK